MSRPALDATLRTETLVPRPRRAEEIGREGSVQVAISLIAPVYDEEANLRPLYERVVAAMEGFEFELLLVDDGSRDRSAEVIRQLVASDPRVRGVFLPENSGQTSALSAGLEHSRGALVGTLDADLQNDPADFPRLIEALGDNDAVVGYRTKRSDSFLRRASSRIANRIRNRFTGDGIRDTGCSMKIFRGEALRTIPLFEGMHRFLPTLLGIYGFRVIEHPVSHHPRIHGRSKYGVMNRVFRALRDLVAVRWIRSRRILPGRGTLLVSEREP